MAERGSDFLVFCDAISYGLVQIRAPEFALINRRRLSWQFTKGRTSLSYQLVSGRAFAFRSSPLCLLSSLLVAGR